MPDSAPIPMDGDPSRDSLAGTIVGRFQIENQVGFGASGQVYRAQDTRLKCPVALKRLSPALRNDALYRRRLVEEAQRAVRLRNDPRVAAVYDVYETGHEMFLIMEFVEGETLRRRLARPIQLQEFLHIASQCAEALIAAHNRGIMHGDIKPENIMLTPAGEVKILDFGVAKQIVHSDDDLTVDPSGAVSGTPAYMAPEILLKKDADGRADIFSLGIVFYEALTGHHPFRADSFSATSDRIRGEKPAPAHSFNPDVSPAVESILQSMLAKKPADRYANAQELLADLDHLQTGLTPHRLQHLLPKQREKAIVRKGFLLGVAAVVAVVLASWGVYAWTHQPPVLKERGWVLISDFDSTGDDPVPDKSIREGLTIALQQSRYVNVLPRDRVYDTLKRMKRPDVVRVDENLGREICLRENAQVLLAGSIDRLGDAFQITVRGVEPVHGTMLFAEQERFNRKEEMFDKVDAISRAVRKDLGESVVVIGKTSKPLANVTTASLEALQLYSQAKDLIDQGKGGQAEPALKEALQQDPNFAMAHLRLGLLYEDVVGRNGAALFELRYAYKLRGEVTDHEQRWIESTYFNVQEHYEEEVQVLRTLAHLYPDDADAHLQLADGLYNTGQLDDAVAELRELIRINPQSVTALGRMVIYLADANHPADAVRYFEQVKGNGIDAPEMHWGLGLAYLALDRADDARQEFQRIQSEKGNWQRTGSHYIAATDMYQGRIAAAVGILTANIERDRAAGTKGFQLQERFLVGSLFLRLNRKDAARLQALQILKAPDADLLISDEQNAGILLARSGSVDEAKALLHRLESIDPTAQSQWHKSCLLNLRGEIALAEGKFAAALSAFTGASEQATQVTSHEGLARTYMASRQWSAALSEWEKVIASRGKVLQDGVPTDIGWALLQSARSYRQVGDVQRSPERYKAFLKLWAASDQTSLLHAAESEMRGLRPVPANGELLEM